MLSEQVLQKIEKLASEIASREGCKIYDVEFGGGSGGRTLRIYIDKDPGPVGIEDCSNVSRGLNQALDEDDPIPGGHYNLEVSSPGLERPLKKTWHFETVIGQKIRVKCNRKLEAFGAQEKTNKSLKQVIETLVACEPEGIRMMVNKENVFIPYSGIERANLVFNFDAEKGEKKKKN
ncbi:MAG: ribosome maturation factor [Oligoflexia bacterium]|nr:MAG: ribosome maturation factor [Oligoflexia bacterium]